MRAQTEASKIRNPKSFNATNDIRKRQTKISLIRQVSPMLFGLSDPPLRIYARVVCAPMAAPLNFLAAFLAISRDVLRFALNLNLHVNSKTA